MAEKFLNEGCKFQCSGCVGNTVILSPKEINYHRTRFGGKIVLTTSTQLTVVTPGICEKLPQNPYGPNCIPGLLPGNWSKFSKHMAGGKNLLLESSEFTCGKGFGKIRIISAPTSNEVQEMYMPQVLTSLKTVGHTTKEKDNTSQKESKSQKNSNMKYDSENDTIVTLSNKDKEKEKGYFAEDLYCPYSSEKEKCRNCKYVNTTSEYMVSAQMKGVTKQPGIILRENYEKEFKDLESARKAYKHMYSSVEEEYGLFENINCGNAAHHILSTKDVYEQNKVKFVLKLANFYEYDVNEAYNCIILPGLNAYEERNKSEFHVRFAKMSDYEKKRFKYYAMRETGRQWHGGGHGKDFENEHNMSCYAMQVTDLLYSYMKNETRQHCRIDEEYYEKDKKRFVKIIHKVIDIVRSKLICFETNPQNSLPYYVSADSYYYAFKIANIKILVFRKHGTSIEVYKYTISRKNGVTYPEERGYKEFAINAELAGRRMIAFCEQIDIGYFDNSNGKIMLPFTVSNRIEVNMKGISVTEYFKMNISSVEAEISEMDIDDSENIMKQRLRELKGG